MRLRPAQRPTVKCAGRLPLSPVCKIIDSVKTLARTNRKAMPYRNSEAQIGDRYWADPNPWVGKILWRKERLPTLVFSPREFHGLYNPGGCRVKHDWATFTSLHWADPLKLKKNREIILKKLKHFGSVQFSRSVMSDCLRPHGLQHSRLPRACSTSCLSSQWCHQPSHPLLPPSPAALSLSQHQGLFQWVGSWHQVVKILELQLQHQSFQ